MTRMPQVPTNTCTRTISAARPRCRRLPPPSSLLPPPSSLLLPPLSLDTR